MDMREISHISSQVHLVDPGDFATLLMQKTERDILVEAFDVLMPSLAVDKLMHDLTLLAMEGTVSTQAEFLAPFSHDEAEAVVPHDSELLGTLKKVVSILV
jgi:hypothetical protein